MYTCVESCACRLTKDINRISDARNLIARGEIRCGQIVFKINKVCSRMAKHAVLISGMTQQTDMELLQDYLKEYFGVTSLDNQGNSTAIAIVRNGECMYQLTQFKLTIVYVEAERSLPHHNKFREYLVIYKHKILIFLPFNTRKLEPL